MSTPLGPPRGMYSEMPDQNRYACTKFFCGGLFNGAEWWRPGNLWKWSKPWKTAVMDWTCLPEYVLKKTKQANAASWGDGAGRILRILRNAVALSLPNAVTLLIPLLMLWWPARKLSHHYFITVILLLWGMVMWISNMNRNAGYLIYNPQSVQVENCCLRVSCVLWVSLQDERFLSQRQLDQTQGIVYASQPCYHCT